MAPGKALARALPHQRAMLPWELISRRDIGLLFLINFAVGMAMFAVLYFMDLYFALVKGNSPGKAGVALLYYLPGLGVGGYMAMFTTNVWPRQTLPPLLLGAVTSAVGITVLAYAIDRENTPLLYGMMALTGHGVGLRMNPGSLHGLAYFPKLTAQVSFLVSFAMPFGGTVALTLMSTVFNNKSGGAAKTSGEGGGGMSSSSSDDAPVPTGDAHVVVRDAIRWAFIAIVPFMWLCVLLTTFLGNVWVGKDGTHDVVNGVYLWNLARGKKLERERRTRGDRAEAAEAAAAAAAATAAAEKDDVEKNKSADTKGAATV
ncbi:hypothetical protein VTK73DRAFT_5704 [Phialemonium thermophilum]|uniref:Uncharacterized protein n=1 Tax=Phialemonium thermophilum TaxID=223376 RepID=A0ABR3V197_9PEZI